MSGNKTTNKISVPFMIRLLLSTLIPIIVIVISFYLGGFAPFGNKNVITASKTPEELFKYYEMYDHFKNSLTDNYSNTLGTLHEYYSDYLFYLSDPTNIIILLFSKNSIPTVIDILYIIKISLCSLFFSIFLSKKSTTHSNNNSETEKASDINDIKKKDKKAFVLGGNDNPDSGIKKLVLDLNPIIIAFSISFSLSGYFLSEGLNINYLLSISLLPLIALGIDRLISSNKTLLLIVTLSISFISNIYISIISLLLITVYFIIESSDKKNDFIKLSGKYILSVLTGLLISSLVLIPVVTGNKFKENISLFFVRYESINNPWNVLSQLMYKSSPSSFSMFDCGVNLYMGLLAILLILTFFINNEINIKYRIKHLIFLVFLFMGTVFSNFNYLFNGFRGFSNNTFIYGYFIVFLILTLAYTSFISIEKINKIIFTITAILAAIIIILIMIKAENLFNTKPLYYSIELLFVYYLIIIIRLDHSMTRILFNIIITIICLFEVITTYIPNSSLIGQSAYIRPTIDTTEYKVYEASKYIHELDADASILFLDSTTEDTTPFNLSTEGYDYIVTRENNKNIDPILEYVTTIKNEGMIIGISIYKNPYSIHSMLVTNDIESYNYSPAHTFNSANIYSSQYMQAGSIFEITDGTINSERSLNERSVTLHYSVFTPGEAYAKTYKTEYIGNETANNEYASLQELPVDRFKNINTEFALFNKENFIDFANTCQNTNNNMRIAPYNENEITSSISGYIVTPIQNASNLHAYNNSSRISTKSILQNCSLISIEKGINRIKIGYSYIYIILGFIISIVSVILLGLKQVKVLSKIKLNSLSHHLYDFINTNYVYISTFIILTIVYAIAHIITGSYPFGIKSTIRDDALSQSFAYYVEKVNLTKNGLPFSWISQSIGMLRDITLSSLTSLPIHPWNYIKYRFLPENMLLSDFTFEFYAYYILNAFSIIIYLTHRKNNRISKNNKILILLGTIYGLSTYATVLFLYESFHLLLFIPLVILGLEKLIYDNKKALYIVALSLMMIHDAYYAFMLCEWIVLIFLTYKYDDIKHFFKSVFRLGIASLASAGIASFRLLPYFFMTRSSGYKTNDTGSIPSIFDTFTDVITMASEYRPLNYMRTMSDANYKSATYLGMIILIVIPLYLVNKNTHLAERIKNMMLVILLLISFNNKLLNYIFHGMHYQTLVPNRFAAVLVFILTCMTADVLINYKSFKSIHLLLSATIATLLYTLVHIINHDINSLSPKLGLGLLIVISIIQIYNTISEEKQKDKKNLCYKLICIVMMIDIISNSLFLFNYNIGSQNDIMTQASYINNLTSHFEDITKPFTGSVYLNNKNQNISCMTDIESPEFFYSGVSSETLDLYNKYNINNSLNASYYGTGNPLADMMMHTKYHIEDSYQNIHTTWYPSVKSVNNLNVYENPYSLPLGFVASKQNDIILDQWNTVLEPTKQYKNAFVYQNSFAKAFEDSKLYEEITMKPIDLSYKHLVWYESYDISKLSEGIMTDYSVKSNESYFIINNYKNDSSSHKKSYYVPITVHICTGKLESGSYYACMNNYIQYLCDITDEDIDNNISIDLNIDIPSDEIPKISQLKESFSIARLDKNSLGIIHDSLSQSILTDITTNGRQINAKIQVKDSGKLYFGLPYSNNWKLYIDNKETPITQYLGGIGADITTGNHIIVLKYNPKGLFEGIIVSIISLLAVIIVYILANKKLKKKQ